MLPFICSYRNKNEAELSASLFLVNFRRDGDESFILQSAV